MTDVERAAMKEYARAYRGRSWVFVLLAVPPAAAYLIGQVAEILRFVIPGGAQ